MIQSKIGHIHLKVGELSRSVDFYTSVLGFKVSEEVPGVFAFLTGGTMHHELALQATGRGATRPDPHGIGLYHSAFEVADEPTLHEVVVELRRRRVPLTLVDHGISKALYFEDPDGNGVEVYIDTRATSRVDWGGTSVRLDPDSLKH